MNVHTSMPPDVRFPSDWAGSEDRVQAAIDAVASDGELSGADSRSLIAQLVGTGDEFMFRYGLNNVLSDSYSAYTSIDLTEGATLSDEARTLLTGYAAYP
jgi:hypothetical protein